MNPADSSGKAKPKPKKPVAKSKAKEKQDPLEPSKFDGAGITFRCKLFGITDVAAARGDKISLEGIRSMKQEAKQSKKDLDKSKQKILINVSVKGLKVYDEKTAELLHEHAVHKISYITHDPEDKKTFGYICNTQGQTGHTLYVVKHEKSAVIVTSNIHELFQLIVERRKAKKQPKSVAQGNQAAETELGDEAVEEPAVSTEIPENVQTHTSEPIYTRPFKPSVPGEQRPPIEQLRYSASSSSIQSTDSESEPQAGQVPKPEEPVSNLLDWSDVAQTQAPAKTSEWVDVDAFLSAGGAQQGTPSPAFTTSSDAFFSQSAVDAISTNEETGSTSSNPFGTNAFAPSTNDPFNSTTSSTSNEAWGASVTTSTSTAFAAGGPFHTPFPQQSVPVVTTTGGNQMWNNGFQNQNNMVMQSPFGNTYMQGPTQQNFQMFPPQQNLPDSQRPSTQGLSLPLTAPLTSTTSATETSKQENHDPFADLSSFGATLGIGRARTKSKSAANSPQGSPCQSPKMGYRSAGHSPMMPRAANTNPFQDNTMSNGFGAIDNTNTFAAPTTISPSSPGLPPIPPREDFLANQTPPVIPGPKLGVPVLPPRADLEFAGQQSGNQSASQQNDPFGNSTSNTFPPLIDASPSSPDPFSGNKSFPSPSTQPDSTGLFDAVPFGSSQPLTAGNDPFSSASSSSVSNSNALFSSSDVFSAAPVTSTISNPTSSSAQNPFGDPSGTGQTQSAFGDTFGSTISETSLTKSGFDDTFASSMPVSQNPVASSTSSNLFGDAFGSMSSPSNTFGDAFSSSGSSAQGTFGGTVNATSASSFAVSSTGTTSAVPSGNATWGMPFNSGTTAMQPSFSDPFGSSTASTMNPTGQLVMSPGNQFGSGAWNATQIGDPFGSTTGVQPMAPVQPVKSKTNDESKPKEDPFASFAIDFGSFKT